MASAIRDESHRQQNHGGSAGNGRAEVGTPSMERGCMGSAVSDDPAFDAEAVRSRESLNALANEDERDPRCGDSQRLWPATVGVESESKHSAIKQAWSSEEGRRDSERTLEIDS